MFKKILFLNNDEYFFLKKCEIKYVGKLIVFSVRRAVYIRYYDIHLKNVFFENVF